MRRCPIRLRMNCSNRVYATITFFTDLCRSLNPLYAELAGENATECAYDVLHGRRPYAPATLYCRDVLLGDDASAFWSTYVYSESLAEGTYGTALTLCNPRR